jgi:hypothetical protein
VGQSTFSFTWEEAMSSLRRLLTVIAALAMVAALGRIASAQVCFTDIDCNDSNPCTFDHCVSVLPFFPGTCVNDALTGPACDDGDACTISDTCQNGFCSGGTNICTCDGGCGCDSDGSCDDGNPCTVHVCENFIDCFGCCHATIPNDGLRCNDGNACTQVDTCQNGVCTGANPVTCTASDQCHAAGTCDPATGACSNPAKPDGTACNDGNQCTRSDSCQAGACVGAEPVVCPVIDQCSGEGACDPATGTCTAPRKPDGAPCDDGNRCTRTDTCMAGACVGANPVVCAAADQCHTAGTCNPATGICTHPLKNIPQCLPCTADGECDDDNACTVDTCVEGACVHTPGNAGVTCRAAVDQCDVAEVCSGTSANCPPDQFKPATTVCRPVADLCDAAESCTGTSAACPSDQLRAAGDVCRPAATACDRAEVCDGISRACPPDASKAPGDGCDDGDPATGTSSCDQALECRGVVGTVTVAPEIVVPSTESPKQVKIPVMVDVPATPGTKQATVVLQGVVDCRDVPSALRPRQCGSVAGAVTAGYEARVESVFLRVTPKLKRGLGRTESRAVTVQLPLTKLGQRLFAKLEATPGGLPMQVQSSIRDRRGVRIHANFPTVLRGQR